MTFPPLKYLNLPNLLTSLAVCLSFLTLVLLLKGQPHLALTIYPLTLGLDFIDGIVARKLGQSSPFGESFDTVADCFNFVFTPAGIALLLGFDSWPAVALLLLYLMAGFWRIVYYTLIGTQREVPGKPYFIGLPTPPGAAWFYAFLTLSLALGTFLPLCLYIPGVSVVMVSGLKYPKFGIVSLAGAALVPLAMAANWFVIP
jgi:CDP-diacylglycerol--serine O-phosphatidyltransferase